MKYFYYFVSILVAILFFGIILQGYLYPFSIPNFKEGLTGDAIQNLQKSLSDSSIPNNISRLKQISTNIAKTATGNIVIDMVAQMNVANEKDATTVVNALFLLNGQAFSDLNADAANNSAVASAVANATPPVDPNLLNAAKGV
jgi:hypothetical protein